MTTADMCLCGHARRFHSREARETGGHEWGMCRAKPDWHPKSELFKGNDCYFFEEDRTYVVMRRDAVTGRFLR